MILSQNLQEVINAAIYLAVNELNHQYLTCEHILFCALDNKNVLKFMNHFMVNTLQLRNKLYQFLQYDLYDLTNKNFTAGRILTLRFTDHLIVLFERLIINFKHHDKNKREIDVIDFILEILLDHESYSSYFLKKFNLNASLVKDYLINEAANDDLNFNESDKSHIDLFNIKKNSIPGSKNANAPMFDSKTNPNSNYDFFGNIGSTSNNPSSSSGGFNTSGGPNFIPGAAPIGDKFEEPKERNKNSFLENYCTNFNQKAASNKIDPVFDRKEEIELLLKALYCRRKGNALFVGDSGVGKTAIIEYLAQKIVNKDIDVPNKFKQAIIYSLDLNSLISGTRYRGDLEERLKGLMNEIEYSKDLIILFIDEIHTVIGTGSTNNGTLDIGNILKPYLARGVIYCIGATTRKEFIQFLSKDKAFLRRFQIIYINEPSEQSAKKMIEGIIEKYATYHNVTYSKNSIEAAVRLSKRYIKERQLPDVALDIIDFAGSSASISDENSIRLDVNHVKNKSVITRKDIETVISQIAKIPLQQISSSGAKHILGLEEVLRQSIVGQNEAIAEVCKSIIINKAGLHDKECTKPIASYIFYGPTGVGKTELTKQLANALSMHMIRIDMSEYSEAHSVSKLFGAPPGYVGYDQNGFLTEQVLKNPYAVILFDEIEKAHKSVHNNLLQILDYGNITDNFGQKVNFNHCIVICTTNTAARSMDKITPGFDSFGNHEISLRELEEMFSPEFRNRFSAIVRFKHLENDVVHKIIDRELDKIKNYCKTKQVSLTIDAAVRDYILTKGYDKKMGARMIDRIIASEIKQSLAEIFLRKISSSSSKNSAKIDIKINQYNGALEIMQS